MTWEVASLDEVAQRVQGYFDLAVEAARLVGFTENVKKYARARTRLSMLGNHINFLRMPVSYGIRRWSAFLSVDLRGSSERALRVGPKNTYVAMHVLVPTLAELVGLVGGSVANLRGDGLIACFGLTELPRDTTTVPDEVAAEAVVDACRSGQAMLEAVDLLVNPLLRENRIPADLVIGVGIDVGEIVVTKIGVEGVTETTVYGDCVNAACHMKPEGHIMLSPEADRLYSERSARTSLVRTGR